MKRTTVMLLLALAMLFFSGCGEQSNSQQTCIGVTNDCKVINNNGGSTSQAMPTPQQTIPATQPTIAPTPKPTQQPTVAPIPKPGDIICKSDWSSGLNGWSGSPDWSTSNGQLVNDGTNNETQNSPTLLSPCDLSHTTNFRLITQIQMQSQGNDAGFGFYIQYNVATQDGYALGSTTDYGRCTAICAFSIAPASAFHSPIKSVSFLPGNGTRTYDIEVKNTTLTVIVDGVPVTQITENAALNGGTIGFWNKHTQLIVNSFQVTAL